MKVAILGAGAIGAYVGAALHQAGADVHLVARGPHLAAMRQHGVRVLSPRGDFTAHAHATDDPADIGPVDYVFLGLKANSYAACGPLIEPLLPRVHRCRRRPERHPVVVLPPPRRTARRPPHRERRPRRRGQCGTRAGAGHRLCGVRGDRAGRAGRRHDAWRAPGSPSGSRTAPLPRCRAFSEAMQAGGLKCPVEPDLRDDIWLKLLGNISFNPISALARATMRQMCHHSGTRQVIHTMMEETLAVAEALNCRIGISIERRLAGAERCRRPPHLDPSGPRTRQTPRTRRPPDRRHRTRRHHRRRRPHPPDRPRHQRPLALGTAA